MKKKTETKKKTVSLDDQLSGGLTFMRKLNSGEETMKTLRTVKRSAEEIEYDAKHIQSLRKKLRISQGVLAFAIGVSPRTVQKWEVGVNCPTGATAKLLHLIETMPIVRDRLVPT